MSQQPPSHALSPPIIGLSLRTVGKFACLALGVCAVAVTKAPLVSAFARAKEKHDLLVLPNPERSKMMSLGYRSAMADMLFAHVLVSSGLHLQEKRRYEAASAYLNIVNELDPTFATPYRFADTILTVQAAKARLSDYQDARKILERGMSALPYDTDLWLTAGQFFAYIAPPRIAELSTEAEANEWRAEGSRRLARSCELVGNNDAIPYHCVTAAYLFSKAGERQALLQFVERILAVTDDPAIHEQALASLGRVFGEEQKSEMKHRRQRLDRIRKDDLPFVGRDRYLVLGPGVKNVYACLGAKAEQNPDCATSLRDFHKRLDAIDPMIKDE